MSLVVLKDIPIIIIIIIMIIIIIIGKMDLPSNAKTHLWNFTFAYTSNCVIS